MYLNTRPRQYVDALTELLQKQNLADLQFPLTEIQALPAFEMLEKFRLESSPGDWIFLTSRTALDALANAHAFARFRELFQTAKFAAVGEQTAAALKEFGVEAHFLPEKASGRDLAAEFLRMHGESMRKRAILLQAERAEPALGDLLRSAGWDVETVPAYRVIPFLPEKAVVDRFRDLAAKDCFTGIVFGSAEAVRRMVEVGTQVLDPHTWQKFRKVPAAVIGNRTRIEAERSGFIVRWMPSRSSFQDLALLLAADTSNRPSL